MAKTKKLASTGKASSKVKQPPETPPLPAERAWSDKRFSGQRIFIGGRFEKLRKDEVVEVLTAEGATIDATLTGATTLVVLGTKSTSHEAKAKKLGAVTASEDELRKDYIRPTAEQAAGMLSTPAGRKRLADLLALNRRQYSWSTDEYSSVVVGGSFENASFAKAALCGVQFRDANLAGANLDDVVRLSNAKNTSFRDATGAKAELFELDGCDLTSAKLPGATLSEAKKCNLTSASLEKASLREELVDCDFTGAKLDESNWHIVKVKRCNFTGSSLRGASLDDCEIKACNFTRADFRDAVVMATSFDFEFEDCDLREADFRNAELVRCVFKNCKLDRARFDGARVVDPAFPGSNPEAALNLVWAAPAAGPQLAALDKASTSFARIVISTQLKTSSKAIACEIHSLERGTWIQVHADKDFKLTSISEAMKLLAQLHPEARVDEAKLTIEAGRGSLKPDELRAAVLAAWQEAFA
ncbi:MAG: pentapeptide repeat-containing protein [Myxococcota bacterium]|nr:pentapeptide repeat-containing protein [Myxococcota bacterium]